MWLEQPYKSQTTKRNVRITVFLVRAPAIWTEASMLKDLLAAVGQVPLKCRTEVTFDQLLEDLSQNSAVFLVDVIDSIAESRRLMAVPKDLHDVTGSSILMAGEQRVDGLLRRYEAFYNRLNFEAQQRMVVYGPNGQPVRSDEFFCDQLCLA